MQNLGFCFLMAALMAVNSPGQSTGSGTATGTAGSTAGAGNSGGGAAPGRSAGQAVPSTPTTNTNQSGNGNTQRTIFISGKVMMDDGSPVPMNVTIQRVCSGNPRSVAYTDSHGQFSFQWGNSPQSGIMSDASESGFYSRGAGGGFGSAQSAGGSNPLASDPYGNNLSNCEVRANLAGYRSDTINLVTRNPMDNPDIGIIVLHRLGNVEGTSISATSYMAPKDAKKAYEKGLQSALKNKPEDAAKEFEKAVLAYPKYADAWMSLGKARIQQNELEPARLALLKAMEADPKLVGPYIELGLLAAQQGKWAEAGPYLDRGLRLDPIDYPNAWYVDAAANFNIRKFDAAEKSAREAQKLDVKHANPRTDYLLGLILAEKRDFPAAAEEFRAYLKNAPTSPDFAKVKDQLSQIEKYLDQTEASKQ